MSKQNRRRMTTRSAMSEYECAIVSTQHSFERLFLFLSFSRSFSLSTREQKETTKTKRSIVYRRERSNDEGSRVSSLSLSFSLVLFYSFLFSSDVVIHVPVVLVSFHVLSIDQTFDSFFQVVIVRRELEFRDDFVDQLRVR